MAKVTLLCSHMQDCSGAVPGVGGGPWAHNARIPLLFGASLVYPAISGKLFSEIDEPQSKSDRFSLRQLGE